MASLARYSYPLDETFDDLFKGFFVRPMTFENQSQGQVRIDVKEDDGAYIVQAEVPGVKKDEINVTINANQVAISAEVKRERQDKQGEKVLRSERYLGRMYRAFTLPQDVDEGSAQAKYNEGVLELRLPKKAAVTAKKLAIQ